MRESQLHELKELLDQAICLIEDSVTEGDLGTREVVQYENAAERLREAYDVADWLQNEAMA